MSLRARLTTRSSSCRYVTESEHAHTEAQSGGPALDVANPPRRELLVAYWDRDGRPMQQLDWVLSARERAVVAFDHVAEHTVNTIWFGVANGFDTDERPLIFETDVYVRGVHQPSWRRKYAHEVDARRGHGQICALVRALYEGESGAS